MARLAPTQVRWAAITAAAGSLWSADPSAAQSPAAQRGLTFTLGVGNGVHIEGARKYCRVCRRTRARCYYRAMGRASGFADIVRMTFAFEPRPSIKLRIE